MPPASVSQGVELGTPIAMAPAPAVTSTNCAWTTCSGGEGVAVIASTKFCMAPEIAVEIAPASARCSGSQRPSRHEAGSASETTAAVSHARAAV